MGVEFFVSIPLLWEFHGLGVRRDYLTIFLFFPFFSPLSLLFSHYTLFISLIFCFSPFYSLFLLFSHCRLFISFTFPLLDYWSGGPLVQPSPHTPTLQPIQPRNPTYPTCSK